MAKSSLLMRAATSGGGSSRLMMVLRRSFSSAWDMTAMTAMNHQPRHTLKGEQTCACVWLCSHTGVTVSFFSAELYCSSERKGSPLGNVSSGDLVAISQTPSYHSSGHRPKDSTKTEIKFLIIYKQMTLPNWTKGSNVTFSKLSMWRRKKNEM